MGFVEKRWTPRGMFVAPGCREKVRIRRGLGVRRESNIGLGTDF